MTSATAASISPRSRADLPDQHIAVTVEHQARQAIRLAEHEAVAGLGVQALAQREGRAQPPGKPCTAHRPVGVARQQTRSDERRGIDVGDAERLATVGDDPRLLPGLEGREGRGGGVDLVAEDPQVAGAQTALFAAPQAQLRQTRTAGGRGRRGCVQKGIRGPGDRRGF
jgi:hypothetical protein